MNIRSIRNTVTSLTDAAAKHGVTLPKSTREAIDTAAQLVADAENYQAPDLSITAAVLDALRAGEEPHASPEVITAVVAQNIRNNHSIADGARYELADAIRGNLDALTAAFKPVYDKAGETLATEHKHLIASGIQEIGKIDLNRVSVDIARSAVKAREALTTLRDIRQALGTTRVAINAPTLPQLYIEYRGGWTENAGHKPISDPWDALTAGHTISLANTDEANARRDGQQRIDHARAEETDTAFKQQFRSAPSLAAH